MACALTQGYSLACRDSIGGVQKFWLAEWNSGITFTTSGGQVITATSGVATFRKYEQEIETGNFKDVLQANRTNGSQFSEQDTKIILHKGQTALRNEIYLLAQNRLFIITLDNNGTYWISGRQRGAMLEPSTYDTGTANGDRNGYELNFKAKEPLQAETLAAGVVTSLGLT